MDRCKTGLRFWRDPHEWGLGKCVRCGRLKLCGKSSGGLIGYTCTRPINHDMRDGHRQGRADGANVTWGKPLNDSEWAEVKRDG